jgi:hypothetical protein
MTTPADQESDKPGKLRTWWHPLLAAFLRWQLGSHYQVQEEVPVGKKPLQIDILLLRKTQGELSEEARKILAGLAEYLNDYTLVELKSPSDTLRAGDFQTLLAYALLYRAQNEPTLEPGKLTLIVIAPRLTSPYADELRLLGVTARQETEGIWRLEGGTLGHPAWLLETAVLADRNHPLLSLISPRVLRAGAQTYEELRLAGYTEMVVYMAQQIQQFQQRGKEFAMQHFGSEEEMRQAMRDVLAAMPVEDRLEGLSMRDVLAAMSVEERLKGLSAEQLRQALPPEQLRQALPPEERLKGLEPEQLRQALPPEERLKGLQPEQLRQALPPEERLKGMSLEDRLKGLGAEEMEQLKELLLKQTKADDNSTLG